MSTQTMNYLAQPQAASSEPTRSEPDAAQSYLQTEEIVAVEQRPVRPSLVEAWVKALRTAETFHLCRHPTYRGHSESELVSFVQAALLSRRDPGQLVAELLAQGAARTPPELISSRHHHIGMNASPC